MGEGMIVDAFLAGMIPSGGQSQQNSNTGEGFQAIMDRASDSPRVSDRSSSDRGTTSRSVNDSSRNSTGTQRQVSSERAERPDKTQRRDSQGKAGDDGKTEDTNALATANTDKAGLEKPAQEGGAKKELESVENELKAKLAEALGITIEEISQILAALNMQPVDLLDVQNLNLFMQTVHEVESPVELLSVPDIGQAFADVGEVLDEFTELPALAALAEDVVAEPEIEQTVLQAVKQTSHELTELPAEEQVMPETTAAVMVSSEPVVSETEQPVMAVEAWGEEVSTAAPEALEMPTIAVEATAANTQPQADAQGGMLENNEQLDFMPDVVSGLRDTIQTMNVARMQQPTRAAAPQDIMNQLMDRMRAEVHADTSEVRIALRPEHLGDVTLRIVTQNGSVTAQFLAENQRVKEVIEANFNNLRDTLQEQGINITNLEVEVGQNSSEQQRMEEFLRSQQRTTRRIRDIINNVSAEENAEPVEAAAELNGSSVDYTA